MLAKNDITQNSTLRSARILCYISESFYAFTNSLPPPSTSFILVDETALQHSRIFLHVPTWCKP